MSDVLEKVISRESFGTDPGVPPIPAQPPYCIDVVTTTPQYRTFYYTARDGSVVAIYASVGTETVITHTCFPGGPGSPGTPPTPPSTSVSFNLGWNGSAISLGTFEGDQMVQFSIDASSVGVVVGLNDVDEGSGYIEMEHAVYVQSGQLRVIESGLVLTAPVTCDTADVITIVRLGTTVNYWLNSTLLYTSLVPSSGTKFLDASLYCGGDKVY